MQAATGNETATALSGSLALPKSANELGKRSSRVRASELLFKSGAAARA
jgi:hypothetical protein